MTPPPENREEGTCETTFAFERHPDDALSIRIERSWDPKVTTIRFLPEAAQLLRTTVLACVEGGSSPDQNALSVEADGRIHQDILAEVDEVPSWTLVGHGWEGDFEDEPFVLMYEDTLTPRTVKRGSAGGIFWFGTRVMAEIHVALQKLERGTVSQTEVRWVAERGPEGPLFPDYMPDPHLWCERAQEALEAYPFDKVLEILHAWADFAQCPLDGLEPEGYDRALLLNLACFFRHACTPGLPSPMPERSQEEWLEYAMANVYRIPRFEAVDMARVWGQRVWVTYSPEELRSLSRRELVALSARCRARVRKKIHAITARMKGPKDPQEGPS